MILNGKEVRYMEFWIIIAGALLCGGASVAWKRNKDKDNKK